MSYGRIAIGTQSNIDRILMAPHFIEQNHIRIPQPIQGCIGSTKAILPEPQMYWSALIIHILSGFQQFVAPCAWPRPKSTSSPIDVAPIPMSGRRNPCRQQRFTAATQNQVWLHSFKSINPMMRLAKPGNPATGCQQ